MVWKQYQFYCDINFISRYKFDPVRDKQYLWYLSYIFLTFSKIVKILGSESFTRWLISLALSLVVALSLAH